MSASPDRPTDLREHWESIYRQRALDDVSWFEPTPETCLDLIGAVAPETGAAILEVGGGASALADGLLDRGYTDITVVDLSEGALAKVRERLGERGAGIRFEQGDARTLRLDRTMDVWHDRAVFHFLTAEDDRAAYLETLAATLRVGGHAVFATFALDGPDVCSALPVQRYSPETLAETLGAGYRPVRALQRIHVTPKQKDQRFTYAVFRREA